MIFLQLRDQFIHIFIVSALLLIFKFIYLYPYIFNLLVAYPNYLFSEVFHKHKNLCFPYSAYQHGLGLFFYISTLLLLDSEWAS